MHKMTWMFKKSLVVLSKSLKNIVVLWCMKSCKYCNTVALLGTFLLVTMTYSFCFIKLWKTRESNTHSSNRVHDMLIHQLASVVIPSNVCAHKGTPLWADSWKTLRVCLFGCSGSVWQFAQDVFFHFNQPRILPPIGIIVYLSLSCH